MKTGTWTLRVTGFLFYLGCALPVHSAVYDHMTLVMNGQIYDINTSVVQGVSEQHVWRQPVSTEVVPEADTQPQNTESSTEDQESEVFPADRIALVAFIIAGFLAARRQSHS